MPGCINGFWVTDLGCDQGFNHFQNEPDIVMFFNVKFVPKVPFGKRLHRFHTDDNQFTLIRVRTPSFTGTVSFASCAMKAKKDWIEILATKCFRCSNYQPS